MNPSHLPEGIPHYLYFVVMAIVAIAWLILIFNTTRPWANFWFAGVIAPLVLCAIDLYLLATFWWWPPAGKISQFATLQGLSTMVTNHGLLLAIWVDLLAMGLVAGAWMARKATQAKMPLVYLIPCLIMTYALAAVGFTLFAIAMACGKQWGLIADVEAVRQTDSNPVGGRPMPRIKTANTAR